MSKSKFTPLVTEPRPIKIGMFGGADSGKTYTAFKFAKYLGGKWAFIDTDGGRSSELASEFDTKKWVDVRVFSNDERFQASAYSEALDEIEEGDYDGVIVDHLSLFWLGIWDKVQDYAEKLATKYEKKQPMMIQAWAGKDGGNKPFYAVMHKIVTYPMHMLVTMQEKLEFSSEGGGLKPTGSKVPIFRGGNKYMYEFTLFGQLERAKGGKKRFLTFDKTSTCHELEGKTFENPGDDVMKIITKWRGIKPISSR